MACSQDRMLMNKYMTFKIRSINSAQERYVIEQVQKFLRSEFDLKKIHDAGITMYEAQTI